MDNRFDHHHDRRRFLLVPFILVMLAAASGAVMFLWNHLLPELFSIKTVSFWQAAGLLVLCRLLFGRFGPGGHHGHHHHDHHHRHHQHRHERWEKARDERRRGAQRVLREKLMQMNEEERKQFTDEWKKRMRR